MKMKLFSELKILAQEILSLDEPDEIGDLRARVRIIHDQLIVIDFLNENTGQTDELVIADEQFSGNGDTVRIEDTMGPSFVLEEEIEVETIKIEEEEKINFEEIAENEVLVEENSAEDGDLFVPTFDSIKDDFSQKEEFKDTISLDETEKLFETKKDSLKQLSLNDKLVKNSIQVGLNDRIAFVNNLFNFSQLEFNKALSVLNDFKSETEAKSYIQNTLKSKYNWTGKEEIEERFVLLVERKFL